MRARSLLLLVLLAGCPKPTPAPVPGGGSGSDIGSGSGSGSGTVPSTIPPELAIPAGNQLTLSPTPKGVQIYECAPDASGAPAWKLRAPSAELLDAAGNHIGVHFGGVDKGLPPGRCWQSTDGS